jgi:DNA invertase Pin-like site-specific DNA recombinase
MIESEKNNTTWGGSALVYCRVSTKALAEGTSLRSQSALCIAHAESLGYAVARVTQEVFSGAELFARPKLSRDRADIRAGGFRALVVYSVDRLTRNAAHLAILADELERAGCRLIFVTEVAAGEPRGEAYAAEVERQKICERVSRGHRFTLLQGRPVFNGWGLYGYRPDREAGVYRVCEPEAAIVRRVFSMCADGKGMHRVASTFNREGIPSPKCDRRPGAKWTSATICDILNNRSYIGEEICLRKKRGPGGRDFPRPESERVRLPDGVRPPLVSRELWEVCKRKIKARAAKMKNSREYPTLLRGYIFCAECGSHMVRNYFKRGQYEYLKYRCGSRWRPFDTGCRGAGVPLEAVHGWAWDEVKSLLLSPDFEGALNEAERAMHDGLLASDLAAAQRVWERGAVRARRQLGTIIAELEARVGESLQRITNLRRLRQLDGRSLDRLTFEEQRLAITTLGFKAYANGDDPARWRYEVTVR